MRRNSTLQKIYTSWSTALLKKGGGARACTPL